MSDTLYISVIKKLRNVGITITKMVPTIYNLQKSRINHLTKDDCRRSLIAVLKKREVLHIVLTAINLDVASEKGLFDKTFEHILKHDMPLYGTDEDLAISLAQLFGSIAVTNYGYLDVHKSGLAAELDNHPYRVFLDDIVSALVASAASRLAHEFDLDYDIRVVKD